MNVVVCVKQVPDPNVAPKLENGRLKRDGVPNVMDPGDEFGVEAGLQLVEAHGGEVTIVTMGPPQAMEAVRKALSMGAHRGILISDPALENADALATARVLAAAIRRANPDLVVAGVESTDGYTGTVPGTVAELLGVPQLTFAKKVEIAGGTVRVQRQTETGYDIVESPTPALVTVTAGVNEPRYPSFKGIVAAKSKPVEQLTIADLGVDAGATQSVTNTTEAPARAAGEKIEDDGTAAEKIAEYLERTKVI